MLVVTSILTFKSLGLAIGSDSCIHVGNVIETEYLLSEFPMSDWLPDISGGYGGPNYIYYGSLGFILPAILLKMGINVYISIKISLVIFWAIGVLSSYKWCSLTGGFYGGMIGSSVFAWSPYYISLAYVRGSYPEFFAVSLYPLLFYNLHISACNEGMKRTINNSVLACAIYSIIIGMHTLSIILITPIVFTYTIILRFYVTRNLLSVIKSLSFYIIIISLLSAIYIEGPFFERHNINMDKQFDMDPVYLKSSLPSLVQIFNNNPMPGETITYIFPGKLHILLYLYSMILLVSSAIKGKFVFIIHAILCTIFLLSIYEPIAWLFLKIFYGFRYLQFPYRWLNFFNLFVSSFVGISFGKISNIVNNKLRIIIFSLVSTTLPLYYCELFNEQKTECKKFESRDAIRKNISSLDQENKWIPFKSALPTKVSPGIISFDKNKIYVIEKHIRINEYMFKIMCIEDCEVIFNQLWHPNWIIKINGKDDKLTCTGEIGICLFNLQAGTNDISIKFCDSYSRNIARIISYISWSFLCIYIALTLIRKWRMLL